MNQKLEKYKHYWTTDRHEYLLIEYISRITHQVNYGIYHIPTKTGVLLEDDTISGTVIDEMIKAGVPITSELPK